MFVALVVLGALMPAILNVIALAKNGTDATTQLVLDLIPLMFAVSIIIGIFIYTIPQRQQ
jgi:sorbitol-specific phosphotransferase system component IIBC